MPQPKTGPHGAAEALGGRHVVHRPVDGPTEQLAKQHVLQGVVAIPRQRRRRRHRVGGEPVGQMPLDDSSALATGT